MPKVSVYPVRNLPCVLGLESVAFSAISFEHSISVIGICLGLVRHPFAGLVRRLPAIRLAGAQEPIPICIKRVF